MTTKARASKMVDEAMGASRGAGAGTPSYDESTLEVDEGNLLVCDPSPVDREAFAADPEAKCKAVATSMAQALVKRLFSFPSQPAVSGLLSLIHI